MKKQIDEKILSIPPYLSTRWENIIAIFLKGSNLVIDLIDGSKVQIPDLSDKELEQIFHFHALYLESEDELEEEDEEETETKSKPGEGAAFDFMKAFPFEFNLEGLEGIGSAMQHNPSQANFPALPTSLIDKIRELTKMISPDESASIGPAFEGCNCIYCQIARSFSNGETKETKEEEPAVSEEDLKFEQWVIQQIEDKLYEVTNKLDPSETYRVFLGNPVGCTCGKENCEHIVAVLKS